MAKSNSRDIIYLLQKDSILETLFIITKTGAETRTHTETGKHTKMSQKQALVILSVTIQN